MAHAIRRSTAKAARLTVSATPDSTDHRARRCDGCHVAISASCTRMKPVATRPDKVRTHVHAHPTANASLTHLDRAGMEQPRRRYCALPHDRYRPVRHEQHDRAIARPARERSHRDGPLGCVGRREAVAPARTVSALVVSTAPFICGTHVQEKRLWHASLKAYALRLSQTS